MKKITFLIGFTLICLSSLAQETSTFKDPRDGKTYKIVKIGNLWIMAENLAYKPGTGNFWIYKNNPDNLTKYGYLYDWSTAQNVAPKGWHLPSKSEWEQIYRLLGDDNTKVYQAIKINGYSGFNATLAGYYDGVEEYYFEGSCGHFWSSTPQSEFNAWNFNSYAEDGIAIINYHRRVCGLSVRLIQDK